MRVLYEIEGEAEETVEHPVYDAISLNQMAALVLWCPILCFAHVASLHIDLFKWREAV